MKTKIKNIKTKLKDPITKGFIATVIIYLLYFGFIISMDYWHYLF